MGWSEVKKWESGQKSDEVILKVRIEGLDGASPRQVQERAFQVFGILYYLAFHNSPLTDEGTSY